jgi:hypothetical protein
MNLSERKVKMTTRAMKLVGFVLISGLGLGVSGGCGQSRTGVRSDSSRLLAAGPAASDVTPTTGTDTRTAPARKAIDPIPVHVMRNPADRLVMMERLRMQIVNKTRDVPSARYAQVVRPDLRGQLLAMGFMEEDADYVLWDADCAR